MFSLRSTIILIFILSIPFCLRTFTGIEPYPAVLLPSGAGTIEKINESITLPSKEFFGIDSSGNWQKINMSVFLSPIPTQYLPVLLIHDFGLSIDSSYYKSRRFKILKALHFINDDAATEREKRKEVEKWLKERLIKQKLNAHQIKITSYTQTISVPSGALLKNQIKDERIILLDQ